MNEKKTNTRTEEEQESILELVEDALVGTHEEVPPASGDQTDGQDMPRPPLKSP